MPVCPNCGTFFEEGKTFCEACGQKLPDPESGPQPDQPEWQKRYQQYRRGNAQYGGDRYRQFEQRSASAQEKGPSDDGKTLGTVSLIFGILSIVFLFSPLLSPVALATGISGVRKSGDTRAKTGLILAIISLVIFLSAFIITAINGFDLSGIIHKNVGNIF